MRETIDIFKRPEVGRWKIHESSQDFSKIPWFIDRRFEMDESLQNARKAAWRYLREGGRGDEEQVINWFCKNVRQQCIFEEAHQWPYMHTVREIYENFAGDAAAVFRSNKAGETAFGDSSRFGPAFDPLRTLMRELFPIEKSIIYAYLGAPAYAFTSFDDLFLIYHDRRNPNEGPVKCLEKRRRPMVYRHENVFDLIALVSERLYPFYITEPGKPLPAVITADDVHKAGVRCGLSEHEEREITLSFAESEVYIRGVPPRWFNRNEEDTSLLVSALNKLKDCH